MQHSHTLCSRGETPYVTLPTPLPSRVDPNATLPTPLPSRVDPLCNAPSFHRAIEGRRERRGGCQGNRAEQVSWSGLPRTPECHGDPHQRAPCCTGDILFITSLLLFLVKEKLLLHVKLFSLAFFIQLLLFII